MDLIDQIEKLKEDQKRVAGIGRRIDRIMKERHALAQEEITLKAERDEIMASHRINNE